MIKRWFSAFRPKTLLASISPIVLGSALALGHQQFDLFLFTLAMICALCLQIAVNLANDYFDMVSGVDSHERVGPVRLTQSGLIAPHTMFIATLLFSGLALISGFTLVWYSYWSLIWFGALSLVAVFAYSGGPWPLASHALGEVTVFFFFGWLAVAGAYFVQTGQVSVLALQYGSVVGLLSAAIMLINNIRDRVSDEAAGKITLAVKLGDHNSRVLFVLFLCVAWLIHAVASLAQDNMRLTYVPLVFCLFPSVFLSIMMFKRKQHLLNQQLAQMAQLLFLYCISAAVVMS